jgi:hypothetical protein
MHHTAFTIRPEANSSCQPLVDASAAASSGPSPHDERNLHNLAMAMLHSHSQQFGAFMEQQRIGQEVIKGPV